MKRKQFRKIIVDNKEYDWLYIPRFYVSYINIYNIIYEKNKKKDLIIRKRRFLYYFDVEDVNFHITPKKVYFLIKYDRYPTDKDIKNNIRALKLEKINKIRKINENRNNI